MTSAEDLKRALLTNLERSGHLKRLKAELLENVFMSLDKSYWSSAGRSSPYIPENPVSDYKFIILELIMEFLAFEHLEFSQSVLRAESGHGDLNISRQTLCQMLGIRPTVKVKPLNSDGVRQSRLDRSAAPQVNSPVPILYYLVDRFKRGYVATPTNANHLGISETHSSRVPWDQPRNMRTKSANFEHANRALSSSSDSQSICPSAADDLANF